MSWTLDPRLAASSHAVADLELCHVRLQDDARWPWLVLIPRADALVELADLSTAERARLMEETVRAGEAVRAVGAAVGVAVEKLNVGALGNVVPQLHVHVVGRRRDSDPGGTGPVWGCGAAVGHQPGERATALEAARAALVQSPNGG